MREELIVDDEQKLAEIKSVVADSALVAIDTEFVRERTYYPELCLIQVATPTLIACIDCLAPFDLDAVLATLMRPGCAWVLHSGRQDLEVVWNRAHAVPARLIDTQIAAALIGFAPQLGLQDLLAELFGIALDKTHTRTDWSRRPLPEAALHYALDDVRHLLAAWRELEARLAKLGRIEWFEDDCRRLVGEPPVADAATVFRRLKGAANLSTRQMCAALALVQWRERRAQAANRPRRWILADEHLLRIARALPASLSALRSIADLPHGILARSGRDILAAIEESDSDALRATVDSITDLRPDKEMLARLQAAVKERADALGIHGEVLATRRDINAIAAGAEPRDVLAGWRAAELESAVSRLRPIRDPARP